MRLRLSAGSREKKQVKNPDVIFIFNLSNPKSSVEAIELGLQLDCVTFQLSGGARVDDLSRESNKEAMIPKG